MTPLFNVLVALGLWLPGVSLSDAVAISVSVEPLAYHGGVACAEEFRSVPGNAQHLCPEHEGPTAVLSSKYVPACVQEAIREGKARTRAEREACPTPNLVKNILAHEVDHLIRGVDHDHADPFREDLSMKAGCRVAYVYGWCEEER